MRLQTEGFTPCVVRREKFFIHTDNGEKTKRKSLIYTITVRNTSFKEFHEGLSSVDYIKRK